MNKLLALILVLLIAVGSVAALAETKLTEYAVISEDQNANPIDGSHFLSLNSGNGKALATLEGTLLTDPVYYSFDDNYGWIVAAVANDDKTLSRGLLGPDGAPIIPVEYDDVKVLNENWAVGVRLEPSEKADADYEAMFGDGYYKITTVDIYNLPSASMVATLPRHNYGEAKAYGQYINVRDRVTHATFVYDAAFNQIKEVGDLYDTSMVPSYTTFNDMGMQGLKGPDGAVILEPTYEFVSTDVKGGYFTVTDYDHYGLCDLRGNLVVPMEYKYVTTIDDEYVHFGYASVETDDGKVGFVNVNTGETFITDYADADCYNRGIAVDAAEGEGSNQSYTILAADGVETHMDNLKSLLSTAYGYLYKPCNANGNSGLYDWHGNEILPCEYSSITVTDDFQYVITRYTSRDPLKIYRIDDPFLTAFAGSEASAEPAEPEAMQEEGADTDGQEAPAPAPAPEGSPAAELLSSAIALLKADPAANSAAAVSLIHSVAALISGNDNVISQLNSVITLLNDNPATNSAAVVTLLESLIPLL